MNRALNDIQEESNFEARRQDFEMSARMTKGTLKSTLTKDNPDDQQNPFAQSRLKKSKATCSLPKFKGQLPSTPGLKEPMIPDTVNLNSNKYNSKYENRPALKPKKFQSLPAFSE